MNKSIRASDAFHQDPKGNGPASLFLPLAVSLISHIVFMALIVFSPSFHSETPPAPSVINVSMVSFNTADKAASAPPAAKRRTPKIEKKTTTKPSPSKSPAKPKQKTVSIAKKPTIAPKTSLKKKTFKSTEVVKHAISQRKEKKLDRKDGQKDHADSPEMLKSALDRLRKEVGKKEAAKSKSSDKASTAKGGALGAKVGKFSEDGKRTAELIDLYRLEVAFQIQKQWAFNEALAGDNTSLIAAIVFKVMPDGEIRDIFFTDRSGNQHLDESAYKAIVKSNPVDGHPTGLNQPYVEMGIRFSPQGIR